MPLSRRRPVALRRVGTGGVIAVGTSRVTTVGTGGIMAVGAGPPTATWPPAARPASAGGPRRAVLARPILAGRLKVGCVGPAGLHFRLSPVNRSAVRRGPGGHGRDTQV